jgi:hypothetical protein
MKVTQVSICPSEASKKAGRPALTPELLAYDAVENCLWNENRPNPLCMANAI